MAGALDPIKKGYHFLFEKKKLPTGVVGSVVLFILLVLVFTYSASSLKGEVLTLDEIKTKLAGGEIGPAAPTDPFPEDKFTIAGPEETMIPGSSNENENKVEKTTINQENLINITFTLTWEDENPTVPFLVNRPDSFGLSIKGPNGQSGSAAKVANTPDQPGMVEVTIAVNHTTANDGWGAGEWEYTVECGDCGDQYRQRFGLLPLIQDTGNDWTLSVSYTYYQEKS